MYFVKLYDAGMAYQFKDVNLSRHSLNISYIDDLFLHQDLDCYFLTGQSVSCEFDFAESTLADGLA